MRGRVEISGINTAKLPVLKNDEMTALLRRAHAGDTAAREQLICGNLRLVLSVLQRFAGRGESADDLFQVGCIGLMKAIDNFDVEQPVRFSTYGVPMIVGEIRRYLRDNSALRISRSIGTRPTRSCGPVRRCWWRRSGSPRWSSWRGIWTFRGRTWCLPWTRSAIR